MAETTTIAREHYPQEMSVELATEYLQTNRVYIYGLLGAGVIPSRMEGQKRRIRREDLDKFLDGKKTVTR